LASGTVPGAFPFDTLQNAVNQANFGDVITVMTTNSFTGPLSCGTPGGSTANGYVVVQSSGALPASYGTVTVGGDTHPDYLQGGTVAVRLPTARVNPSQANLMPKITAGTRGSPAISFAAGAKFWKFRGFEILPAPSVEPVFQLVLIGNDQLQGNLPDHIWFDQCYIHANPTQATYTTGMYIRNGIQSYSNRLDVTCCFINEIKGLHNGNVGEAHAINPAEASNGPLSFVDNYIEGAGHSIIFGGAGAASSSLPNIGTATDSQGFGIRLQFNTFSKNLQWNSSHPSYVIPPTGSDTLVTGGASQIYVVKVLTEWKTGINALVDHNIYQYNWAGDQTGQAISFNTVAYTGVNYEIIQNFTITNNVIDSVVVGFEFATNNDNLINPRNSNHVTIRNNQCTNLMWQFAGPTPGSSGNTRNSSFTMWSNDSFVLDHNTQIWPNPASANAFIYFFNGGGNPVNTFTNLIVTNNIGSEGQNGYFTVNGSSTSNNRSALDAIVINPTLTNNLIYDAGTAPPTVYPGDLPVASQSNIGFNTSQTLSFPNASRTGGTLTFTAFQAPGGIGADTTQLGWGTTSGPPFATSTSINNNTPISISQGTNAVVNVQVTSSGGTPTGPVTLILNPGGSQQTFGPLNLTNGQVTFQPPTFSTASLTAGSYTLAANYAGIAGQFNPSSGSATLTVTGALPRAVVGITPTTVTYPNNSPIAVHISPPSGQTAIPTGTVNILVDGVQIPGQLPLSPNGFAYFILNLGNAGNHAIIAMYSGDTNYAGATGTATATVNPASDTMTVQMPSVINQGQNATVVVTLTSP
jgi:hypothetical protein